MVEMSFRVPNLRTSLSKNNISPPFNPSVSTYFIERTLMSRSFTVSTPNLVLRTEVQVSKGFSGIRKGLLKDLEKGCILYKKRK